ncbi:hypothetical protein LJ655_14755 [Paraburkholderia sp. MMS20-SJTN17]|uniref:Uncharacterized protein n=1 Tax=Paraburkholderia translucens TaxID=2886945 RepID=A0ABS8KFB2_9BURK|nr:hypothetical protein [Paraburkholderia sp. MMS20-SJTN17]MCC8403133.1 hypothetical protein [Paraburkholderia sp. MMS20-SJTN17]
MSEIADALRSTPCCRSAPPLSGYSQWEMVARFGAISLAKQQVGMADGILRRSSWRERASRAGCNYDPVVAFAMSLEKPLPPVKHSKEELLAR